ncbi:MAG: universal stress protein [Alphaproteobacteria bacterium]|nr:universal stress protein [Alphaproteobacteria bacterium]
MKTVLVPMNEAGGLDSMLSCATVLARRFSSHVEGFYQRRSLPDIMAAGAAEAASSALLDDLARRDDEAAGRARSRFETALDGHSRTWREEAARHLDISERARAFDLAVVGRPTGASDSPSMSTLEAVLFESGRPILVAPPQELDDFGTNIAILWNGSTETARTIAMGMELLTRAERVLVVTVEGAFVPGPSAAEIADGLARHGLSVESAVRQQGRRSAGEAMLAEAAAFGANLVFKGGYTSSRLRQMILGGPTNHILAESTLPVFMAH